MRLAIESARGVKTGLGIITDMYVDDGLIMVRMTTRDGQTDLGWLRTILEDCREALTPALYREVLAACQTTTRR